MILLGIGTNIGNKTQNLQKAIQSLTTHHIQIIQTSSFYITPAWGKTDQDDFLNAVIQINCKQNPHQLLELVLNIENQLGRIRTERWGPRIIDIDVLEYNRVSIDTPKLRLPHPLYTERPFTLVPLLEIAPDFVPTNHHQSIQELVLQLPKTRIQKV